MFCACESFKYISKFFVVVVNVQLVMLAEPYFSSEDVGRQKYWKKKTESGYTWREKPSSKLCFLSLNIMENICCKTSESILQVFTLEIISEISSRQTTPHRWVDGL